MQYRSVVLHGIFLELLLASFWVPTSAGIFGKTSWSLRNGKIDNHVSMQENTGTKSLQSKDNALNKRPAETNEKLDGHADEGLVFEGEFNYQSDIVPMPTMSSPDLFKFFSDPKNRDLVIKGGGNPCERIPLTPELHDQWTSQSKIVKSTPPNGNAEEEILAVYSEVPIVPGLSLRAVSYTGCKTMKEPTSALPYYEFTLLEESYQPVGKKAMTWIFDKVTGNKKINRADQSRERENGNNDRSNEAISEKSGGLEVATGDDDGSANSSSRKTYALSRVMLKPYPQDGGCKICYYGHVRLTLSKRFLHMLPLPTKVVQAKVNKSIRKQLECECTRSMKKFTGALNRWNENLWDPNAKL